MSGINLSFSGDTEGRPNAAFGGFFVITTATSSEYSQIQIAAGARGLWLHSIELASPDNISLGIFSTDQLDGAVDSLITHQSFGPAVQATVKHGTSLASIHSVNGFSLQTGVLDDPVYCPPNQFLVVGDRIANTTLIASLRFLEYL